MRPSSPRPRHEHTDHTRPWRTLREVFAPRRATPEPAAPQGGPQDLDVVALEVAAMWSRGIPFKCIPGHGLVEDDHGHPIPGGGGSAA